MLLTYSVNTNVEEKQGSQSAFGWDVVTTDLVEFLDHTSVRGHAVMPALQPDNRHKNKEMVRKYCTLIVDVDNDPSKNHGYTSFEEATKNQFLCDNAVCMWGTPSSGKIVEGSEKYVGQDRFRILFKLKEDIEVCDPRFNRQAYDKTISEVKGYIKSLHYMIPGGDRGIGPFEPFLGTLNAQSVHVFNEGSNLLDVNDIPDVVPIKPTHVAYEGETKQFSGSRSQSFNNARRMVMCIPSDSYDRWVYVLGLLKNIAQDFDDDQGCELAIEWSVENYSGEKNRRNDPDRIRNWWYEMTPGTGGWYALKELAMEYGYEPKEYVPEEPVDVTTLFTPTEGYKVSDPVPAKPKRKPGLTVNEEGQVFITDARGKTHDVTYAKGVQLMNKDLIPALEAVTNAHRYRFNTATMGVMCDGVEMSGEELDNIQYSLSREYGINFPKGTKDALMRIAMDDSFDPYVEELENIEKNVDAIDISNLATRYFKATSPMADVFMEKWLVGLVGRLLQPGLNQRGTLVIVGKQEIGKDGFLETLVNGPGRIVSVGAKTNLKDVNFMLACSTAWVANLDEIERVTKNQIEGELKSWLTRTEDRFAVKYKMYGKTYQRRFSLYGSCNNAAFLQDPTGNTRYWIIESPLDWVDKGERVDFDLLASERDAILAGAIAKFRLYQQGEYNLRLTHTESKASEEFNKGFVEDAAYLETLGMFLQNRTTTCMSEIYAHLGIEPRAQFDKRITNQIKLSLDQLGWEKLKSARKIRRMDYPEFSCKLIVKDGRSVNTEECYSFFESPGQKWSGLNKNQGQVETVDFDF